MSIHKLIDSFDVWTDEKTRYRVEILQKEDDNSFGYSVFAFCQIKDAEGNPCSCSRRIFNGCQIDSHDLALDVAKTEIQKLHDQINK